MIRRRARWLWHGIPALEQGVRRAREALLDRLAGSRPLPAVALELAADGLARAARQRLISQASLQRTVAALVEAHGCEPAERVVAEALARLDRPAWRGAGSRLYVAALNELGERSAASAIAAGETWLPRVGHHPIAVRTLARWHERAGGLRRPLELLQSIERRGLPTSTRARLAGRVRVLDHGLARSVAPSGRRRARALRSGRILYYASQTLPHHSTGYAVRTHWMARHLRARHWDVSVHARLGYPVDRPDFPARARRPIASAERIDGVPYSFLPDRRRGIAALDIEEYQDASVSALMRVAESIRPEVIHCASNWAVGLAGVEAARRLGIPSIYEVRGLWHLTRSARQPTYERSDQYQLAERLEAQAARGADRVLAITGALRDVAVGWGVPAGAVSVVPNAVDVAAFAPDEPDAELAARWGLVPAQVVIGYVGSFNEYEGLDLLLQAAAALRERVGDRFRVLLVGDGASRAGLEAMARRLQIADLVVFAGRQPHAHARRCYSLIDISVFPRKGLPVCEVVSPLKPFEAMATRTAVVVSDVAALTEIVEDGRTGLVHRRDDAGSLAERLAQLVNGPALRASLAEAGRTWTQQHRAWPRIIERVEAVYRDVSSP